MRERTEIESELLAMWSELIGVPVADIDRTASFLSASVDSFAAIMFCMRVEERFGARLTLERLAATATFEALVEWLAATRPAQAPTR